MTGQDLRDLFGALSRGDVTPFSDRLSDDVVFEFPGSRFGATIEGRRRVTVFLKQNQRLFRDGLGHLAQ